MRQEYREALQWVRDQLAEGKLEHVEQSDMPGFNMAYWGVTDCGTAGCIGGWMEGYLKAHGHKDLAGALYSNMLTEERPTLTPLYKLCFPSGVKLYEAITPAEAVQAIDNVLDDGDPDWYSVVEEGNRAY